MDVLLNRYYKKIQALHLYLNETPAQVFPVSFEKFLKYIFFTAAQKDESFIEGVF